MTIEINDHCSRRSSIGCMRCDDGYYLVDYHCLPCSEVNDCQNCLNETYCTSCPEGYYVNENHTCSDLGILNITCKQRFPDNSGCVICNDGWFAFEKECFSCQEGCHYCLNAESCIECEDEWFMIEGVSTTCQHFDKLTNCQNKTQSGCIGCEDGYYLRERQCYECMTNCTTCSSNDECTSCIENFVLKGTDCLHFTKIEHCQSAKDDKCDKCESGYEPSDDGKSCMEKTNLLLIVGVSAGGALLIIIVVILIIVTALCISRHRKEKQKMLEICTFPM